MLWYFTVYCECRVNGFWIGHIFFSSVGYSAEHKGSYSGYGYIVKKTVARELRPDAYTCHLCGFRTAYSNSMKRHIAGHSGEKPFKCNICSARFTTSQYLKRHNRRVHKGEKSFHCGLCPKTFFANDKLQTHMRVHSFDSKTLGIYESKQWIILKQINIFQRKRYIFFHHLEVLCYERSRTNYIK